MRRHIVRLAMAATLTLSGQVPLATPASAYQVDCATLPRQSFPNDGQVIEVQATDGADIDISGDAFDFVRSIRVYHIQYRQHENRDGDCNRSDSMRLGSYGVQGDNVFLVWIEPGGKVRKALTPRSGPRY